jgi:hypothetical protein
MPLAEPMEPTVLLTEPNVLKRVHALLILLNCPVTSVEQMEPVNSQQPQILVD